MWKMTLIRILLVVISGIILFYILSCVLDWRVAHRLRRRKRSKIGIQYRSKYRIILIYTIALSSVVTLSFLVIKYYIRGVL